MARTPSDQERLFLAVFPDERTLRMLKRSDPWLESLRDFRATPASKRHLTLLFLGDTSREEKNELIEAVRRIASETPASEAPFMRIGALPNPRRARIIVAMLNPDTTLGGLMRRLQNELTPLVESLRNDSRPSRPPLPHITLARLRSKRRPSALDLRNAPELAGVLRVSRLALVRSRLTSQGPEYETIFEFPLLEAGSNERAPRAF